jgi:hypothetical protein
VLIVANQHRSMSQIIFSTIFATVLSFASLLTPLSGLAMAVVPNASCPQLCAPVQPVDLIRGVE